MDESLQLAIQYHQSGQLQLAQQAYETHLLKSEDDAHAHYLLGALHMGADRLQEALKHLSRANQLQAGHPSYLSALGHALVQAGRHEEAAEAFQLATRAKPNYGEAWQQLAECLEKLGRKDEAAQALEQLAKLDPQNPNALLHEARSLRLDGKLDSAGALLQRIPEAARQMAWWMEAGAIAFDADDYDQAETYYRKAHDMDETCGEVHLNLAVIFERQGKLKWAYGACETALAHDPELTEAIYLIGKLACKLNVPEVAYERLTEAKERGIDHDEILFYLGQAYHRKGETRQAIIFLQQVIARKPDYFEAYLQLGGCLRAQSKHEHAVRSLRKAIELKPEDVNALIALSAALMDEKSDVDKNMSEALELATKAQEKIPNDPSANFNLANVYMSLGRPTESMLYHDKALEPDEHNPGGTSSGLFNRNYLSDVDAQGHYEHHRKWGERYSDPLEEQITFSNTPEPNKRLRVGYTSPDLCIHPVGYFFKPIFEAHDPTQVETFCYFNNYSKRPPDQYTRIYMEAADHFEDIGGQNSQEIASLIREHELDILVDLAGHSCGNCLLAMSQRLAPVQVSWLGYPNTTGSKVIDYRLSDRWTEPPEHQAISSEELYHLPNGFNAYEMPYQFPEVVPPPCLKNGYISFGSFNNTCKVTREVLETWATIVKRVPNSRLLLKDKYLRITSTREYVLSTLEEFGLERERVEFLPFSATNLDHLKEYGRMDIALDTFPYNGTTTTMEILLMGLPAVTFYGDRHAARVTGAMITRAGHPEWVGADREDYMRIAVELAQDPQKLAELREGQRERVMATSLYNGKQLARDVEEAFRSMWKRWCEQQASDAGLAGNNLA